MLVDSAVHPCCFAVGAGRLVFDSHACMGVTTLSFSRDPSRPPVAVDEWEWSSCSRQGMIGRVVRRWRSGIHEEGGKKAELSFGVERMELSPYVQQQAVDRKRQTAWG